MIYLNVPNGISWVDHFKAVKSADCPKCKMKWYIEVGKNKYSGDRWAKLHSEEVIDLEAEAKKQEEKKAEELKKFNADPNNFYSRILWCFNCDRCFEAKIPKKMNWKIAIRNGVVVCNYCDTTKKRVRWMYDRFC